MAVSDKAALVKGLRSAFFDDNRSIHGRESLEGKFIPDRIAFELYDENTRAKLKAKYDELDRNVEESKVQIQKERREKELLAAAWKNRRSI